ncbi:MAG: hypothetical protein JWN66_922 [Sphingomonas bacterium]|uniref:DUF885 family protein n=1 Tax=Sphingomonas bacterium TaxID=1895847 RepID=UPI0026042564|nr:DUF885 family protein [Sphingomonas bacterium]MDB5703806.1 hypothetical protein [Sphingomonas bacterium]
MNRRDLLAAAATTALLTRVPAFARTSEDQALRAALDGLGDAAPEAKLDRLKGFSPESLSRSAALDLVTVRSGLRIDAELARRFAFGKMGRSPYSVSFMSGAWREAGATAERIDADTVAIDAEAAAGVVLPADHLERTITAIRKAELAAMGEVATALSRQVSALEALRPHAGDTPGVGRLRDGDAYFALLLERHSGEHVDPAAAHERFVDMGRRLHARADTLLRRQGLTQGPVGTRIAALFREERWLYSDDDAGRDRAVADMNRWLDRARSRVLALFGPVPAPCLDVSARRMSAADETAKRQGYRVVGGPSLSGIYFVDLAEIRRRPSWSLQGVVHHELLPGHMIQFPIEQMADPHRLRLEYTPAFPEGWAIYAEQLAGDDGAFGGDPMAFLGHTHWLLFRIGRAIIDTGVHFKRWSTQQALKTLREVQGEPAYFAPFATDIDRTCLEPGIRAAEALNWLRLSDMSPTSSSKATSPALRHFHRAVLADGRKRLETIDAELKRKPGQLS